MRQLARPVRDVRGRASDLHRQGAARHGRPDHADPLEHGSKLLADLYRPGSSDEAAWHLSRVFRESAAPDVAADCLASTYDPEVVDLLPAVTAPTVVLHYRGDRLIPFRGAQDLVSGLPSSTLVPLDGRVHLPNAADLDQIERTIVRHLHRHHPAW